MPNLLTPWQSLNERICAVLGPLGDIPPGPDLERLERLLMGLMRGGSAWPVAEWTARRALVYEMVYEASQAIITMLYETWHYEEIPSLARFVIPQSYQVEQILDAVCEARGGTPGTRDMQQLAMAIYQELATRKIHYDKEKLSLGAAQRVRRAAEILRESGLRKATCLETSLLFAACIEAAHGQPIILQFVNRYGEGHAVAGFWLAPPRFREVVYFDPAVFSFKPHPDVIIVETTGIAVDRGIRKTYPAACKAGRAMFTNPDWSLRFAVDIAEARSRGLMPWEHIGA
jgi:hypothetical protein